jgi:hypothetical protein
MNLLTPAPNATFASGQPVSFSWDAAPYSNLSYGPYQIELDVAPDPGFNKMIYGGNASCTGSLTRTSTAIEGPFAPGVYYWRATSSYQTCMSSLLAQEAGTYSPIPDMCSPQSSPVGSFTVTNSATPAPAATPTMPTIPAQVRAFGARVRAHQLTRLPFTASDNSAKAAVEVGIHRGATKTPLVMRSWIQAVQAGVTYGFSWTPPRPGTYRFCVLAQDVAGTPSNTSCATVSAL